MFMLCQFTVLRINILFYSTSGQLKRSI